MCSHCVGLQKVSLIKVSSLTSKTSSASSPVLRRPTFIDPEHKRASLDASKQRSLRGSLETKKHGTISPKISKRVLDAHPKEADKLRRPSNSDTHSETSSPKVSSKTPRGRGKNADDSPSQSDESSSPATGSSPRKASILFPRTLSAGKLLRRSASADSSKDTSPFPGVALHQPAPKIPASVAERKPKAASGRSEAIIRNAGPFPGIKLHKSSVGVPESIAIRKVEKRENIVEWMRQGEATDAGATGSGAPVEGVVETPTVVSSTAPTSTALGLEQDAIVVFDFVGVSQRGEIDLSRGAWVKELPAPPACNLRDGWAYGQNSAGQTGVFPRINCRWGPSAVISSDTAQDQGAQIFAALVSLPGPEEDGEECKDDEEEEDDNDEEEILNWGDYVPSSENGTVSNPPSEPHVESKLSSAVLVEPDPVVEPLVPVPSDPRLPFRQRPTASVIAARPTRKVKNPSRPADHSAQALARNLAAACSSGDESRVKQLLEARASPNQMDPITGDTPLIIACLNAYNSIVEILLASDDCDLNATSRRGKSVLHVLVETGNDAAAVWMVKRGASPALRDDEGRTPVDISGTFAALLAGASHLVE